MSGFNNVELVFPTEEQKKVNAARQSVEDAAVCDVDGASKSSDSVEQGRGLYPVPTGLVEDITPVAPGGAGRGSVDEECMCLECRGDSTQGMNWFHAAVNLVVAVIGTGVLGLPLAFSQLNFTPSVPGLVGSIALTAAFFMNWYASWLMSSVHYEKKPSKVHPEGKRMKTFIEVSDYTLGKKFTKWVVTPLQVINLVSTGIAYLIACGQNSFGVYSAYDENGPVNKLWYWTTMGCAIQLVLALFPSLESFKWVSYMGAFTSMYYSFVAITLSIYMHGDVADVNYDMPSDPMDVMWNFFVGLSTLAFLFGVQSVQPDIQATLRANSPRDAKREYMNGFYASYLVTIPLYFGSALAGYLTFGQGVSGMILNSISKNSDSSAITAICASAQVAVVIHVLAAYQVWSIPMYMLLEEWTACLVPRRWRLRWPHFVPVRFVYVIFTWFVAIAIPFFGDIMALNGSLTIVPLCFILPCVFYLKYTGMENVGRAQRVLMAIVIGINSVVGVFGVIASIRQIVLDASSYAMFT